MQTSKRTADRQLCVNSPKASAPRCSAPAGDAPPLGGSSIVPAMEPDEESVMSKHFRIASETVALDALGLEACPHSIAPFGEAAVWVTLVYDDKGQLLGRVETHCKPKAAGVQTDYVLACAAPTALEARQRVF